VIPDARVFDTSIRGKKHTEQRACLARLERELVNCWLNKKHKSGAIKKIFSHQQVITVQ